MMLKVRVTNGKAKQSVADNCKMLGCRQVFFIPTYVVKGNNLVFFFEMIEKKINNWVILLLKIITMAAFDALRDALRTTCQCLGFNKGGGGEELQTFCQLGLFFYLIFL